jgi:hypothetical protein
MGRSWSMKLTMTFSASFQNVWSLWWSIYLGTGTNIMTKQKRERRWKCSMFGIEIMYDVPGIRSNVTKLYFLNDQTEIKCILFLEKLYSYTGRSELTRNGTIKKMCAMIWT